ncbi:hypothetical protein BDR26DRAFT_900594 [Obelidium mucronatum]|nr:hypothetical protein BDR26DRAFT_900594 [Obelidium mucronatum]
MTNEATYYELRWGAPNPDSDEYKWKPIAPRSTSPKLTIQIPPTSTHVPRRSSSSSRSSNSATSTPSAGPVVIPKRKTSLKWEGDRDAMNSAALQFESSSLGDVTETILEFYQ